MNNKQEKSAVILAGTEMFDYLKEKVGERKTRTEAYCDLLDKALAGFVSPFLRKQDCELRSGQCHVTISDLASEWHWHRATVRSFLDTLESLGQLERTRLTKSVIITMSLQPARSPEAGDVQEQQDLAARLREALSDWITGNASAEDAGKACGQLVRRALAEIGLQDIYPPDSMRVDLSKSARNDDKRLVDIRTTALENIALAAMQRVLRKSRFDDCLDILDFFRLDLGGDWAAFIETSKDLVELLLNPESTIDMDEEEYPLKSLRKPFLSLVARAQEAAN